MRRGEGRPSEAGLGMMGRERAPAFSAQRHAAVPVSDKAFSLLDAPKKPVTADYHWLASKHPEYFKDAADVQRHVEFVLHDPERVFPGNKVNHKMLYRWDSGSRRVVVIGLEARGREDAYAVTSAYNLSHGQFKRYTKAGQGGSSPPQLTSGPGRVQGATAPSERGSPGQPKENIAPPSDPGKPGDDGIRHSIAGQSGDYQRDRIEVDTDAAVKSMAEGMKRDIGPLARWFATPDDTFQKHPVAWKIYNIFRDRVNRAHEILHTALDLPDGSTVMDCWKALPDKGKALVNRIIDVADVREIRRPDVEQWTAEQNIPEPVREMYRLMRDKYDALLPLVESATGLGAKTGDVGLKRGVHLHATTKGKKILVGIRTVLDVLGPAHEVLGRGIEDHPGRIGLFRVPALAAHPGQQVSFGHAKVGCGLSRGVVAAFVATGRINVRGQGCFDLVDEPDDILFRVDFAVIDAQGLGFERRRKIVVDDVRLNGLQLVLDLERHVLVAKTPFSDFLPVSGLGDRTDAGLGIAIAAFWRYFFVRAVPTRRPVLKAGLGPPGGAAGRLGGSSFLSSLLVPRVNRPRIAFKEGRYHGSVRGYDLPDDTVRFSSSVDFPNK